jgi:hypothetical protein
MATEEVDFIDEEIDELLADIEDKMGRAAKLKDLVAKNEVGQLRSPCCLAVCTIPGPARRPSEHGCPRRSH